VSANDKVTAQVNVMGMNAWREKPSDDSEKQT